MTAFVPSPLPLSAADRQRLERTTELCEQGLYLQAYAAGRDWGELTHWPAPAGLVLAARLAWHLGGMRLSDWIIRRAYRVAPLDCETRYYYGYSLLRRSGPYRTWRWMRAQDDFAQASADVRSSWHALLGEVAASLRDFTAAEHWLAQAKADAPQSAWVRVCAAYVLEQQDRYDDALTESQRALELRPNYRPAVQSTAHLLSLLDRDAEAVNLLRATGERLESGALSGQLFGLLMELKQYEQAEVALQRFIELSPLLEKKQLKSLNAQRAEIAYHQENFDAAITFADESSSPFHKAVAERLRDPVNRTAPAKLLQVGFVRQHRMTCAPATLSALSRYWSMPADHLQVADEICYDGTSHYNERKWATTHGWIAREFTVTEPITQALIDRDVPFTFTTVDPGSAHLQAIIGYDARRGTVLIRDPFWRNAGESLADKLLEKYSAYGPRGMVLVPQAQADKLADLELPDAPLWDVLHQLDHALEQNQRETAESLAAELEQTAPNHRLALEARRRLAIYDGHPARHLAVVEQLIEQFPKTTSLQLERLQLQRHQTRRAERLQICEQLCAERECHPIFWQLLAEELQGDARRREDMRQLLLKGIRRWPSEAFNYKLLANIHWDERRYDEALELYRIAACLGDKDEALVESYFAAARWRRQTGDVLQLLEDRFLRFGAKSYYPARTLVRAYLDLNREADALATLEKAIARRPEDGLLLLYSADIYLQVSHANAGRAQELLQQAKGKSPPAAWERVSARLAQFTGQPQQALAHWRVLVGFQPMAVDGQRAIALLLAQTEGPTAALQYLQQLARQFPCFFPFTELWIEWLREETADVREAAIREVLEINPDDAWLQRELAYLLADSRRFDEAWQHCDLAGKIEPRHPSYLYLRGLIFSEQGKVAEAHEAMRQTIAASVDSDFAINGWINLCTSLTQRQQVLQFIQEELVRQVTTGEGLLTWREHALNTLAADEVLALLRDALASRPDLWPAWSAVVRQLLGMNLLDEAWSLIEQATQKFPLTVRLWLDRALVARARLDSPGEVESLTNALRINPDWSAAARLLADVHERRGQRQEARQVLEQSLARNPLDVVAACHLAELQWRLGERAAAVDRLEKAAILEPGYESAWDSLSEHCRELGCEDRAIAAARGLAALRPGESRSWLRLASALPMESLDEKLAALRRAIELNPRCDSAYDQQAVALALRERWDEAIAACNPPAYADQPPAELRLRHGWVEAHRGNLPEAVRIVEALVGDEPHLYPAWARLCDWYFQLGNHPQYLVAAEALVRISPQHEVSLGYLAEARQLNGDQAGAKEVYVRAFELNPRYEFAGICLFDMQLEAGEIEAAARTIATLHAHGEGPLIEARRVQLAAKRQDVSLATSLLPGICRNSTDNEWPIRMACEAMVAAGWSEQAQQVVSRCVADEELINPELANQWVRLQTAAGNWSLGSQIRQLMPRGRLGEQSVKAFVECVIRGENWNAFHYFYTSNWHWLSENVICWGAVGRGLCSFRHYVDGERWCRDWQQRSEVLPWMLVNVVEAFRATGRDAEARAATAAALAQPSAHGQHLLCIWQAIDAAVVGDTTDAQQWLDRSNDSAAGNSAEQDPDYDFLIQLTRAAIAQAQQPAGDAAAYQVAQARIAAIKLGYAAYLHEPGRQRVFRSIVRQIARRRGGVAAWCWSAWARLMSYPKWL